jgi:Glycosyl transferases group 1/Coenzyme PQQ synthesis protein D (PqqD)
VQLTIAGPGSNRFNGVGLGYVDNLDEFYDRAAVAVVPIQAGSGTRIKAIEAWAHGVPVVGTTMGLAGLHFRPGMEALVADTAAAFAASVEQVLQNPTLARTIGQSGRLLAEETFAFDVVKTQVHRLIRATMDYTTQEHPMHERPQHAEHLDVTQTEDGLVVFEPTRNKVHHLNTSAAVIFDLIDGTNDEPTIAAAVQALFKLDETPTSDVASTLQRFRAERLVR